MELEQKLAAKGLGKQMEKFGFVSANTVNAKIVVNWEGGTTGAGRSEWKDSVQFEDRAKNHPAGDRVFASAISAPSGAKFIQVSRHKLT